MFINQVLMDKRQLNGLLLLLALEQFTSLLYAFSALTLLVGQQEGHPVRYWSGYLSGTRCQ